MTKRVPDVPQETGGDVAHRVARIGLGAVPMVGGPAVEIFQWVMQPPLERRRNEWMEQVGKLLEDLSNRGIDIEALRENEEFVTVVMHASQIAVRNHQEFKKEALRNAIQNIAEGQSLDDAVLHMSLDLIDTLSEMHVRILRLFQAPPPIPGMSMGGLSNVLERNIPELRNRQELYRQFWRDLFTHGLINTEGLNVTMSSSGLAEKRTTELGDAFLAFISHP